MTYETLHLWALSIQEVGDVPTIMVYDADGMLAMFFYMLVHDVKVKADSTSTRGVSCIGSNRAVIRDRVCG